MSFFQSELVRGDIQEMMELQQFCFRSAMNFVLLDDERKMDYFNKLELLIEKQKIVLGGSSGINIAGAIKLAKKMGPGKTIVTILCDHGKRYASKIFNKEFLKSKNLPIPKWL